MAIALLAADLVDVGDRRGALRWSQLQRRDWVAKCGGLLGIAVAMLRTAQFRDVMKIRQERATVKSDLFARNYAAVQGSVFGGV